MKYKISCHIIVAAVKFLGMRWGCIASLSLFLLSYHCSCCKVSSCWRYHLSISVSSIYLQKNLLFISNGWWQQVHIPKIDVRMCRFTTFLFVPNLQCSILMSKLVVSTPVQLQAVNMVHRLSIHYSKYIYHNVVLSDHQFAIGVINIGNISRAELEWTYARHLLLQLLIEASAFSEDIMVRCQLYQLRIYSCLQARTKSI